MLTRLSISSFEAKSILSQISSISCLFPLVLRIRSNKLLRALQAVLRPKRKRVTSSLSLSLKFCFR